MTEEWAWLIGFENKYQISTFGNVRMWKGAGRQGKFLSVPKPVKPCLDPRGYYNFTVWFNGSSRKVVYVHREMAKLFLPNPLNMPLVRHLNDNKIDNTLSNLAWGTHKENRADGIANGRHHHTKGKCAVKAKLNEIQVVEILLSKDNNCVLGRKYGVSESAINKIKNGLTWQRLSNPKHRKYIQQ